MVTIFHCGTFGVNFGNSGLDNANWDKISHSITKKSHKWEESGRRPKNFLLAFIDELWKIQTFENMKKFAGDIILRIFTRNHNHMRYSSWDTKWDRIFCHDHMLHAYWDMECSHRHIFTPLLLFRSTIHSEKLKFGRNIKKHLEILSFYACVRLIKIRCTPDVMYGSWDMKFNREN